MIANQHVEQALIEIKDDTIREFTQYCLEHAPPYFWEKSSSSTGKYHPPQSNGDGGLVRHTVAVATIATRMCSSFGLENAKTDAVLSACLLHDIVKYGLDGRKYTTNDHDFEGAVYVKNLAVQFQQEKQKAVPCLRQIIEGIAWHMGPWTNDRGKTRALKKFPEEYEPHMMIVHLADNVSANKHMHLLNLEESLVG